MTPTQAHAILDFLAEKTPETHERAPGERPVSRRAKMRELGQPIPARYKPKRRTRAPPPPTS